MNLRNKLYYVSIIIFLFGKLSAVNTNPLVASVVFSIFTIIVTVTYCGTEVEQSSATIGQQIMAPHCKTMLPENISLYNEQTDLNL